MIKSDFETVYVSDTEIYIRDLNLGNMSVTNDAEGVVQFLYKKYGQKKIIYRDSDGFWDQLYHEAGKFIAFVPMGLSDLEVYAKLPDKRVLF